MICARRKNVLQRGEQTQPGKAALIIGCPLQKNLQTAQSCSATETAEWGGAVRQRPYICEYRNKALFVSLNHSLMKADTYLKNFFFSFRRECVCVGGGHSEPTSWYKFAQRNTGLIVWGWMQDAYKWQKRPPPCTAQWLTYNKSTKGGFNGRNSPGRCHFIFFFFTVFNWTLS